MADDDVFQQDHRRGGGGAAAGEQAIPRWQSNPPPGLMQYLEQQRIRMGQQGVDPGLGFREQRRMGQQDVAPGPIPAVNQMEQALGVMERALEDQNNWKSIILPRGHIIAGFLTRRAVLAQLKVLCHAHGFKVGSYRNGHKTSYGVKTLKIQCSCGRPRKKTDSDDRHFNSRHSCLDCKWSRYIIPVENGPDGTWKWIVSPHLSSQHCIDHTGHIHVPPAQLAGIATADVQTIISEHGMLDSISALQDRIHKKTNQYFSWRRLRHMVARLTTSGQPGSGGVRPPKPGKSQELVDWLVMQQAADALKFTMLTMDLDEIDAPEQQPLPRDQEPQPVQEVQPGIIPILFARIRGWFASPQVDVQPAQPVPAQPVPAPPEPAPPPEYDVRGRKKRTKKKKRMIRTRNGRQIDANRIVTVNGVKKILLGVAWVTAQERAMFELYPDIIGCDTKAKINEFKLKCLGFIGKDPDNSIFTVCRMYIPNESTETFDWSINVALPLLLGHDHLLKVRLFVTDDCSRMGPVLDDACKRPGGTGCLRNAKRALCTFHIFNRDYNADLSGYGQEEWFRIFRDNLWGLQGSETHAEKDARYEYILNCLNTWDCLGTIESEKRKKALNFLAKKWRKRHLWVLVYFNEVRHFMVRTTSFVEGEWGSWCSAHLNLSHLNSLLTATTKLMKWRVTRLLRKCASLAQTACTKLSRPPSPASGLSTAEFHLLDRWVTDAERDAVEEQYELASIVGMWVVTFVLEVHVKSIIIITHFIVFCDTTQMYGT